MLAIGYMLKIKFKSQWENVLEGIAFETAICLTAAIFHGSLFY